jgi:outer membrane protein assembly factor BamB
MPRRFLLAAALLAAFCANCPLREAQGQLLPETTLAQHGLTRSWFARVELAQGRTSLRSIILYEGVLYMETDAAIVYAIDAETGKTLWSRQIGRRDRPSLSLDAHGDLLAVVNGSRLYVANRFRGDVVYEKEVENAPGAGAALSAQRVYVPCVGGLLIVYRFDPSVAAPPAAANKTPTGTSTAAAETLRLPDTSMDPRYVVPQVCHSGGCALVQPLVTRDDPGGEYVVWPADGGNLNFGRIGHDENSSLSLKYRLKTEGPIVARPAYLPPDPKSLGDVGTVFVVSGDGFLYAVQEEDGSTLWRFSTGEPIVRSPVALDNRVYLTTQLGGMYCLDAKSGVNLWRGDNVGQFVAASKTRVYATDTAGRILVLSAASGAVLDAIVPDGPTAALANSDTDRIYLISNRGLIQCLCETQQVAPLVHNKERKAAAKAGLKPPATKELEKPKPAEHHVAPSVPATPKAATPKASATPEKKKPAAGGGRAPKGGNKKAGGDDNPFGVAPAGDVPVPGKSDSHSK